MAITFSLSYVDRKLQDGCKQKKGVVSKKKEICRNWGKVEAVFKFRGVFRQHILHLVGGK